MIMATPPPCFFLLFFVSHVYPWMFGVWALSFVSVMHAMLHSYSSMAAFRLSIFPVIPLAFVYSIFNLFIFWLVLRVFVRVLLFMFLNRTCLVWGWFGLGFFRIDLCCGFGRSSVRGWSIMFVWSRLLALSYCWLYSELLCWWSLW